MYDIPDFKEKDFEVIKQFIGDNPFALMAGCDADNKPVATQVPVSLEEKDKHLILTGHIMKNTDHHKAFLHNPNVLTVFSGKHSYVSATWYSNPHTASTWNYMSVYAKGIIQLLDDEALAEILRKTSLHFEDYNHESATAFDNLPEAYTRKMMQAIVAFEIKITQLDNVFKLSQNMNKESYENIVSELKQGDASSQAISDEMNNRANYLFDKK